MPRGSTKMPVNFSQRKTGAHQPQLRQNNLWRWWCPPRALFCTQTCPHKAELLLRQQLPKQTECSHAQQVTEQFHQELCTKARSWAPAAPQYFMGSCGCTEPGRISLNSQLWLPHTHTLFKGTQNLQFSSAGAGEGKAGEGLTCAISCVHCRPQSSLCTIAVLQLMQPRTAHREDSPPGKSQNKQSFRGLCLHTPQPCTRPLSLKVKKAC